MERIIVGITGASGSVYGLRLIDELIAAGYFVHVIVTRTGRKVVAFETGNEIKERYQHRQETIFFEDVDDFFARPASGSYKTCGMVIIPCSMGTIGSIASGASPNLLVRCALVCLKEKRPLIVVPRETPYSEIDLENLLKLKRAGADIVPASPGFYHLPKTIDELSGFLVGKVFDQLGIDHELYKRWGEG